MNHRLIERPLTIGDDDLLGHDPLMRIVMAEILRPIKDGPQLFAVFGPWGSGKTTLLRRAIGQIEKDGRRDTVEWAEFDAWRYQARGDVLSPLLYELERVSKGDRSAVMKTLLAVGLFSLDGLASFVSRGSASIETAKKNLELAEELLGENIKSAPDALRSVFEGQVDKLSAHGKKRFTLVIDNLDRCTPEGAVGAIEALYVIMDGLSLPVTIIVVADQDVISSFISKKYEGTVFSGARFLEKVFPHHVRIPDPWVWFSTATKQLQGDAKHTEVHKIRDDMLRLLRGLMPVEVAALSDAAPEELLWRIFGQSMALRNPRRVKRVLRRLSKIKQHDDWQAARSLSLSACILLIVLAEVWPEIFRFFHACNDESWRLFVEAVNGKAAGPAELGSPSIDYELRDFFRQFSAATTAEPMLDNWGFLSGTLEALESAGL